MTRTSVHGVFAIVLVVTSLGAAAGETFKNALTETLTGPHRVISAGVIKYGWNSVILWGIDALNENQQCRRSDGACYQCGRDATLALRNHIGNRAVRCEVIGPTLPQVYSGVCFAWGDSESLNRWLVLRGFALAHPREYWKTPFGPDEELAHTKRAGIHASDFVPPWRWLRGDRLVPECPR